MEADNELIAKLFDEKTEATTAPVLFVILSITISALCGRDRPQ